MTKCSWMSGTSRSGLRLQEAATLGEIGGHQAASLAAVALDGAEQGWQPTERGVNEVRIVGGVDEHEIRMVLQIAPDARQMMHDADAVRGKRIAVADARQHQQLR